MWITPLYALIKLTVGCSHEMLAPGGYLDSQTTDTQYFDATNYYMQNPTDNHGEESQNNEMLNEEPSTSQECMSDSESDNSQYTADSEHMHSPRVSPLPPIINSFDIRSTSTFTSEARIAYGDHRPQSDADATKLCLWRLLDASVNGPDYGDGRSAPWFKLPTVTRRQPGVNYIRSMRELWRQRSSNESDLMSEHVSAVHRMAGASPYPPSILQGEFVFLADFLSHLFPMMVRAATESDLVRMQEMINVGNDLLTSMQTLVDVEANAREEINRTYNTESSDA